MYRYRKGLRAVEAKNKMNEEYRINGSGYDVQNFGEERQQDNETTWNSLKKKSEAENRKSEGHEMYCFASQGTKNTRVRKKYLWDYLNKELQAENEKSNEHEKYVLYSLRGREYPREIT